MHRLAGLFILVLATGGFAQAQYSFGLKAGFVRSRLTSDRITTPSYYEANKGFRTGRTAGVYGEWRPEGRRLGVRAELLYMEQGEQGEFTYFDGSLIDIDFRRQYVALPLLASYKWGPLALEVGPQVGFLLSSTLREENRERKDTYFEEPILDIAANAGLRLTHKRLQLGFMYSRGLISSFKNISFTNGNGEPLDKKPTEFNESFILSLAYRLTDG